MLDLILEKLILRVPPWPDLAGPLHPTLYLPLSRRAYLHSAVEAGSNRKPGMLIGPGLRAGLEVAAQTGLEAADRIVAVLDHNDGDTDYVDGADDEPSLAALEAVMNLWRVERPV